MKKENSQKTLLIIGGSGFVSGTLARHAESSGWQVWVVTRGQRKVPEKVHHIIVDRHQHRSFQEALIKVDCHWDVVVDAIGFEPRDARQDIELFASRTNHLIFISSDFVYHPAYRQFPQPEDASIYMPSGYGGKKRLCEIEFIQSKKTNINWTIVRPGHIYGPGSMLGCLQCHARDPQLLRRLLVREPLKLVGGGYFLQQPIYVADLAKLILDMAGKPNTFSKILNAAGPDVIESWRYYAIIAGILGVDLRIEEIPTRIYLAEHPESYSYLCHRIYSLEKLKLTGIKLPSTPINLGLQKHVFSLISNENIG